MTRIKRINAEKESVTIRVIRVIRVQGFCFEAFMGII